MRTGIDHELGFVAVELAIDKYMVALDRELEALITANLKKFAGLAVFPLVARGLRFHIGAPCGQAAFSFDASA